MQLETYMGSELSILAGTGSNCLLGWPDGRPTNRKRSTQPMKSGSMALASPTLGRSQHASTTLYFRENVSVPLLLAIVIISS